MPTTLRLCLLVALGLNAHPAFGYELSGQSWPQDAPGDPVTLTYSYSDLLTGELRDAANLPLSEAELRGAIEEAFSVWAEVAPLHFVEVPDQGGQAPTGNYRAGQYGQIRIGSRHIDGAGNIKAVAYFPPSSGATRCTICGDIHFDTGDRWEEVGTLDLPDVLGAAIHEIGHAIGLAHTDIPTANMFPVFLRHTGPGSGMLHEDDIAGVQAIYGVGVGSVTPLAAVPEPDSLILAVVLGVLAVRWRSQQRCSSAH